jgi:two-component sensor histidine kinase
MTLSAPAALVREDGAPRKRPRVFAGLLLLLVALLIAAVAYTSVLIVAQQDALADVSRYNLTWVVSQGALEVSRLEEVVGAYAAQAAGADRDAVELRFDIVVNRAGLLGSGDVGEFIRESPDLLAIARQFQEAVAVGQPLVDGIDQPDAPRRLLTLFAPLDAKLASLAAAAYARGSELAASDLIALERLHWIFSAILLGLMVCSLGLTVLLGWNNRQLRLSHAEVNALVAELRTAGSELLTANARLSLMVNELNHRVKNTLATVQALATQTLRGADSAICQKLEERLFALAAVHDVLTRESWEGADLSDVMTAALAPFGGSDVSRFLITGPPLRLCPRAALALAMALHELATNAVKYGALSSGTAEVEISWEITDDSPPLFRLIWAERGGPTVIDPSKRGFGSRLIERGLAQGLGGAARLNFDDPAGATCLIEVLLARVVASISTVPFPHVDRKLVASA